VDFHRGFAEDLPFEDNAFHYALLVATLEFVQDPQKALEEACRVAKDGVFLWVLNKFAIKGIQRRVKGLFADSIYNQARFFSIWELKQIVRDILGNVPVVWRTVCQLPIAHGRTARHLERFERSELVQRCPFGEYTGMLVTPAPRYIAKPLSQLVTARNTAPES
jgi:SAM-dependent methyltransferase